MEVWIKEIDFLLLGILILYHPHDASVLLGTKGYLCWNEILLLV